MKQIFTLCLLAFLGTTKVNAQCPAAGTTWKSRTSVADNYWTSVTYGNGLFVAVSADRKVKGVMTSLDGITWTSQNSAADNRWYSVTYGNGLFVAVSDDGGSNQVMTSSDGTSWTSQTSAANKNWYSVTYGNGLFVAVAANASSKGVMTSSNGIDWTSQNAAANNDWQSVTYGNGVFVAVANSGKGNRVMTSSNGIDWTSRTSAADNRWFSVTYGNGLFVAVSEDGTGKRVMTSTNGVNWTSQTPAADNQWHSVTYGNGLFVAVAQTGTGNRVMTSPDGSNWKIPTSAADNQWNSIAYGNGVFVAVAGTGTGNRVMTSSGLVKPSVTIAANPGNRITKGTVVTLTATPANGGTTPAYQWKKNGINVGTNSVTYTDAALEKGDIITCVLSSSDPCASPTSATSNGITIMACTPTATTFTVSACGSYTWVANNNKVYTASNNSDIIKLKNHCGSDSIVTLNLTIKQSTTSTFTASVCGSYTWVAKRNKVYTESNTTDTIKLVNAAGCDSIVTLNLTINALVKPTVTIAANPGNSITKGTAVTFTATPTNGGTTPAYQWKKNGNKVGSNSVTYTDAALENGDIITCVLSNKNPCTATSNGITMAVTYPCPAGTTWTSQTSAAITFWSSVTYGKGLFVAVSSKGEANGVMTSPDGIIWTSSTPPANKNAWQSVTYGDGLFVAVANSGEGNRVMTSHDGINWTSQNSAADNNWRSITYGKGLFVAVAQYSSSNGVMTSPDGITWTSHKSTADNRWASVTYGNDLFVAVSETGTGNEVMTSPDGINWTSRTSAAANYWNSVTYGNGLFVAVAWSGTGDRVMTSPDGITWTSRTSAADNDWNSVTYGNGIFVAVASTGTGNRVMTSSDGITWTSRTSAADDGWSSLTYGNGKFAAVSYFGTVMTSSPPLVTPSVTIAANPGYSITTGTAVTFTATPTNGGITPAYQWKKNGNNIGSNSVTYTDAALAKGDIITCVLTSNNPCTSTAIATSSGITMVVTNPCKPTDSTFKISACGSYTWVANNNKVYTASNNSDVIKLKNHCGSDSIVTLNLTINTAPTVSIVAPAICTSPIGDVTLTASADVANVRWMLNGAQVNTNSNLTTVPATSGITVAGAPTTSNMGGAAANQFNEPKSVWVDTAGNIYVSDKINNRIQKFPSNSTAQTNGTTVAGGNGIANNTGSAANQLYFPKGITLDNLGNLYVVDQVNNRVQKFPPNSTSLTNGVTVASGFSDPVGICLDGSGNLYVTDKGTDGVIKFLTNSTTGTIVTNNPPGALGYASNVLGNPTDVKVDATGNIYVTDVQNGRIAKFPPTMALTTQAGTVAGGNNNNGSSSSTSLKNPTGICFDALGNLYVADEYNNRIQKFPANTPANIGQISSSTPGLTVAGDPNGNSGPENNQLYNPCSVFVDALGNIFIADQKNHRIQKWTQSQTATYTPTASGNLSAIVTNAAGCSATSNVVIINNTPSTNNTTTISACGSYTWANTGQTYTASGTYIGTTTNCVTEKLNLTITPSSNNTTTISACNSYTWANTGQTYTASGTYTGTTTNCVTEKLNLTITPSTNNTTTISACNSYTWANTGQTYTASGTYTGTTTNCVTEKLNLTILPILPATINITSDNNNFCKGILATFTATITNGGTAPIYQWKKNGVNVGTNASTYSDANLSQNDKVFCTLTSNAACVTVATVQSNTITMTVKPSPAVSLVKSNKGAYITTLTICNTEKSTLYNDSHNGLWSSSNTAVATAVNGLAAGGISSSGLLSGVSNGTTLVTYTITNKEGCSAAASVTVQVTSAPSLIPITGNSDGVCVGKRITLTNSNIKPAGATASWTSVTPNLATVNGNGAVLGVSVGTALIKYAITEANGCVESTTTTVQVKTCP